MRPNELQMRSSESTLHNGESGPSESLPSYQGVIQTGERWHYSLPDYRPFSIMIPALRSSQIMNVHGLCTL